MKIFYALATQIARPVDVLHRSGFFKNAFFACLIGSVVGIGGGDPIDASADEPVEESAEETVEIEGTQTSEPDPFPLSTFPTPEDTEPLAVSHPQLSPAASAATITLPERFTASVFAAEPDVQNPIDMAWDHRGRMWIAENYTYAKTGVRFRDDLRDRVVVFTDEDCDGKPEQRAVFLDTVSKLTSVEVGLGPVEPGTGKTGPGKMEPGKMEPGAGESNKASNGESLVNGVWLMCPPQLLFVPDADADLIPDSEPRVVLDGFDIAQQNYHNFANGLRFGPDGWLYGRCGGSCPGRVGPPGTPEQQRVALEGGMWRYDIRTQRFEVIAHGTTNPWGHDFNEFGDLFFINTVNGHLWHAIDGAHFNRPFTLDPNPNVYATIDQHADHYHFDTGQHWTKSRDGAANDLGGGHAHCGLMIYQETTWPKSYRGSLMTLNFHGRRANRENLVRTGSGYVGTHGDDFFLSGDEWFRGMEMSAGPDGNVFVLDWSDLGECHEHTGVHRNSGRIYKITAAKDSMHEIAASTLRRLKFQYLESGDLRQLFELVLGRDRWFSHQAAMRLRELKESGTDVSQVIETMRYLATTPVERIEKGKFVSIGDDAGLRCRLLWSLDQIGGISESGEIPVVADYTPWLRDASEHVRAAAIRSLTQHWPIDDVYGPTADSRAAWPGILSQATAFVSMLDAVGAEDSAMVRLALASTLQRLPETLRAGAAAKILQISGDRDYDDHNFAKMIWFGLMMRSSTHPGEMTEVVMASELPELTTYAVRSVAEQVETQPAALDALLAATNSRCEGKPPAAVRRLTGPVLTGIEQGLVGIRRAEMPAAWAGFRYLVTSVDSDTQSRLEPLDAIFGDGMSVEKLQALLNDETADPVKRLAALKGWVAAWQEEGSRDPKTAGELVQAARPLVGDPRVNLAAAESLATIDHVGVAELLADNHGRFRSPLRPNVIAMLCSRALFAEVLVQRLEQKKLSKEVLDASHIRSIVALGDEDLTARVEAVWGRVRETPANRTAEISRLTAMLASDRIAAADRASGRVLFDRACASCHKMFGNGETVGPDLTGAQRSSLDYLLHNMVDPDAVVGVDYRATKVLTVDGRLLVGLVTARTRRTMTIASATGTETIALDDVEEEFPTETSPMPSGLLQPLSDDEIADLIAYLQSPVQVAGQASSN